MRLVRVRLRDFRGVADRTVEFAPAGVTVVEGPNEVGKSSIAEAIDLLFGELDSAAKQSVKDVKPVDRDVGPEVELEVETGSYSFTYRKRFLRDRETVLTITRPRPESLTGRDAHDRVRRILDETIDEALWKALRISQGSAVDQARVHGLQSLAGALDRAAGTVPEGPGEASLFERARAEYLLYWTDTGKPKADAAALASRLDEHERALAEIEVNLQRVDDDVARMGRLQVSLRELGGARAEADRRLADLQTRWKGIEALQATAATREAQARAAGLAAQQARETAAERKRVVTVLVEAIADRDRRAAAVAESAPALVLAAERAESAARTMAESRAARSAAESLEARRRADLDFRRAETGLAELGDRKRRVDAAHEALTRATATLAANRVDEATMAAVRSTDLEVRMARARLDAGRPTVLLEALGRVAVELDGDAVTLEPGRTIRRSIADRLRLVVPGTLAIEVAAGTGDARLADALAEAETRAAGALATAGVASLAAAESAAADRREAHAARRESDRTIAELLGTDGLAALAGLEAAIAAAEDRTAGYLEARPAEPAVAPEAESARQAALEAEHALAMNRAAADRAEAEERAARDRLAALQASATEARVHLQVAEAAVDTADRALAVARMAVSDEALAAGLVESTAVAQRAADEAAAARADLERQSPEQARLLLDNAEKVLAGASLALRQAEDERLQVETRLRDHGEDGLAEKRDLAITLRDAAARELAAYRSRAAARRLLFETLRRRREEAHLAYGEPLRDRIEALGRVVFGASLHIDLTRDLRIASRTLDHRTVPFDSLSVGAREQLGIITRLACAMIIAPDGGVPLILDDALGYSDPGRLEAMGAVLALAGRSCQVIVLTCYPERYRHVGGATVRRIN